jgi:hypothetical protein
MRDRVKLERVDSEARRYDIEMARKLLFEKRINISSVKIERILGPTSMVPTSVCVYFISNSDNLIFL